jgi:hypothetical protein
MRQLTGMLRRWLPVLIAGGGDHNLTDSGDDRRQKMVDFIELRIPPLDSSLWVVADDPAELRGSSMEQGETFSDDFRIKFADGDRCSVERIEGMGDYWGVEIGTTKVKDSTAPLFVFL